ncbi:chemotaxis protein CheV [[Bacillus] enclensis]|uniref:Two-component system, chemotaxis family, response regulator CheV n=1 Tax=[Bacillus] enclensis TaxID=1402860 RepID=A0A0V8HHS9_9BACI|nr:chemotaxis protein [[Bacillus] enclensis]OAT83277.1 chemotaxis protein CheV [Bacillus sp. MKU004]QTC42226.1 chemotaxis protein CheV [Bacillus sp. V3]QWC24292.1 chemotaxis protein [Bacillus haikouensis]KSU62331.1 chemotaxis protein CheV [[Bacillus] enclensis]MBH9968723.1 chemotaxis protein CheV [[Bacillus] enclensis]
MNDSKGILLESGTNELEMVEFEVQGNKFGINVIKVKEIIQPAAVIPVPHSHTHVKGLIQLRGEVLPVVDMARVLGLQEKDSPQSKFIVCEFNKQKVVFHVHNVTQIHRISWNQIEKPSEMYSGIKSGIIGVVKREDSMVLMLDFESIMVEINPESGIHIDQVKKLGKRERRNKKIVAAEDSPLLRKLLNETLTEAGYDSIEFFENGADAFAYLESLSEGSGPIEDSVGLVLTDVEMPQMDGHHLTKRIKSHPVLKKLPVIIFSSLITNDLRHKGELVGAEDQVSKPEIAELISKIDQYVL